MAAGEQPAALEVDVDNLVELLLGVIQQLLAHVDARRADDAIEAAGAHKDWTQVMDASAELHDALHAAGLSAVAPYAVSMAYRIRYYMEMNAREAMHLIELRTAPQGHPAYRRICQAMHTLIRDQAGHDPSQRLGVKEGVRAYGDHQLGFNMPKPLVERPRLAAVVGFDDHHVRQPE